MRLPLMDVWDRKTEVIVLHVGDNLVFGFEQAGEQLFPCVAFLTVQNYVVHMGLGGWNDWFAAEEINIVCRSLRIETAKNRAQNLGPLPFLLEDRREELLGSTMTCLRQTQISDGSSVNKGHAF